MYPFLQINKFSVLVHLIFYIQKKQASFKCICQDNPFPFVLIYSVVNAFSLLLNNMAFLTKTRPQITWSPVPFPSKENFLVKIVKQKGIEKEERGILKFKVNQTFIPLFVTDSMAKHFERPKIAIMMVWHGAKAAQLRRWIEENVIELQKVLPLKLRIIFIGGGNDLTLRQLPPSLSTKHMIADLINEFCSLNSWCDRNNIALTISSVLPRPAEIDEHKSQNEDDEREALCHAIFAVNTWLENWMEAQDKVPLPLNFFVEYENRRTYPDTQQRRIVLSNFNDKDWTHLSAKGVVVVWKVIQRFLDNPLCI